MCRSFCVLVCVLLALPAFAHAKEIRIEVKGTLDSPSFGNSFDEFSVGDSYTLRFTLDDEVEGTIDSQTPNQVNYSAAVLSAQLETSAGFETVAYNPMSQIVLRTQGTPHVLSIGISGFDPGVVSSIPEIEPGDLSANLLFLLPQDTFLNDDLSEIELLIEEDILEIARDSSFDNDNAVRFSDDVILTITSSIESIQSISVIPEPRSLTLSLLAGLCLLRCARGMQSRS